MLYSNSSPLFLYNERQRLEIKCLVPSHRMWPVTRSWTSQLMLKTRIPHQLFPGLKKSFQATIFLQFGKLNFKKKIIIIAKHLGFIRSLWIETDDRSLFFFASLSPSIAVFLCAQNKQPGIFFLPHSPSWKSFCSRDSSSCSAVLPWSQHHTVVQHACVFQCVKTAFKGHIYPMITPTGWDLERHFQCSKWNYFFASAHF